MQAGKLDRRIQIEQAAPGRDPQTRAATLLWPPDGGRIVAGEPVSAEPLDPRGSETYGAQQRVAEISIGWRVRWQDAIADVAPKDIFRVVYEGRAYDILDGPREDLRERRRGYLLIFGRARAE